MLSTPHTIKNSSHWNDSVDTCPDSPNRLLSKAAILTKYNCKKPNRMTHKLIKVVTNHGSIFGHLKCQLISTGTKWWSKQAGTQLLTQKRHWPQSFTPWTLFWTTPCETADGTMPSIVRTILRRDAWSEHSFVLYKDRFCYIFGQQVQRSPSQEDGHDDQNTLAFKERCKLQGNNFQWWLLKWQLRVCLSRVWQRLQPLSAQRYK